VWEPPEAASVPAPNRGEEDHMRRRGIGLRGVDNGGTEGSLNSGGAFSKTTLTYHDRIANLCFEILI
jgi:hypothetical protein